MGFREAAQTYTELEQFIEGFPIERNCISSISRLDRELQQLRSSS